jgi:hypothetical protein
LEDLKIQNPNLKIQSVSICVHLWLIFLNPQSLIYLGFELFCLNLNIRYYSNAKSKLSQDEFI